VNKNGILEEFERNRRIYLGPRIEAAASTRRNYLSIMRRFVAFCGSQARPPARRIRDINQDHYAAYVRQWCASGVSPRTQYAESLVLATFAEAAGLKIKINAHARLERG
jgi:hypothetical protein